MLRYRSIACSQRPSSLVGAMDDELLNALIDDKVPTFAMQSGMTTAGPSKYCPPRHRHAFWNTRGSVCLSHSRRCTILSMWRAVWSFGKIR